MTEARNWSDERKGSQTEACKRLPQARGSKETHPPLESQEEGRNQLNLAQ